MPNPQNVVDPVCGMTVDPATAAGSSTYQGTTYYFCSAGCKTRFDANPTQYAGKAAGGAPEGQEGGAGQNRR